MKEKELNDQIRLYLSHHGPKKTAEVLARSMIRCAIEAFGNKMELSLISEGDGIVMMFPGKNTARH